VLLDNALEHGAGRVVVRVSDDGPRARLSVEDEGPGVPADAVDELFERGTSSSPSSDDGGGGTGIGLHLAHVLATSEGGRLRLERAAPPRFELTLPHRRAAGPPGYPTLISPMTSSPPKRASPG